MSSSEPRSITRKARQVQSFQITDQVLESLQSAEVPDEILEMLKGIKDQQFANSDKFLRAVQVTIGPEQKEKFKSLILLYALVIDEAAETQLMELAQKELERRAKAYMRKFPRQPLEAGDLVNDAYFRLREVLRDPKRDEWVDRLHFFNTASVAMRYVLLDYARKMKDKDDCHISLSGDENLAVRGSKNLSWAELINLDKDLKKLKKLSPKQAKIIDLYCFGGLKQGDIAKLYGQSLATIKRELSDARAFLLTAKLRSDV